MIVVINFSHPLNDEAERTIIEDFGAGETHINRITVQLDMEQPLAPQLAALVAETLALPAVHGNPANVDAIIPPGHSAAAAYMARAFPTANLIVISRRGGVASIYLRTELIRP